MVNKIKWLSLSLKQKIGEISVLKQNNYLKRNMSIKGKPALMNCKF